MNFTLLHEPARMFVAGEWLDTEETNPVENPATGETVTTVPVATTEIINRAVAGAVEAQREWGKRTYAERAAVLQRIIGLVDENLEELAQIVVAEQGKPLTDARGEIGGVKAFFDFPASQRYREVGQLVAPNSDMQHIITKEYPVGVVVAIIPWNFPAAIFARKVAPALMAGNAIIVKPSGETPLSSLALAKICQLAGLPDGLLSVLTGPGRVVGNQLVEHPDTDMITVTGSTRAGKQILAAAAEKIITVSLELGGKAPFLIFDDADLDAAVDMAVEARLMNCGQVCTCNERLFVQRGVYDEVVRRVIQQFEATKVGDPMIEGTKMGPKVSGAERDKVAKFIDDAIAAGAKLECGGSGDVDGMPEGGHWMKPTVLTQVTNDMDIAQHEVFGPVLPIIPFDTYEEVVEWANSTDYGLTAYAYTSDLSQALRLTDDLHFGEVYINQAGPETVQAFHTGWKLSGLGGDDGPNGFEKYLRKKSLYLNYAN